MATKEVRTFKGQVDRFDELDQPDEYTPDMRNCDLSTAGALTPRLGSQKLQNTAFGGAINYISNFRPLNGRPVLAIGTDDGKIQSSPFVVLQGTILSDADNDALLPIVDIDNNSDFSSITITADGTSSVVGFTYFDGANWQPVLSTGITSAYYKKPFRYTTQPNNALAKGTVYYWRYRFNDGTEDSANVTPAGIDTASPFTA